MTLNPFMILVATGSGYHRLPVTIDVEVKVIIMVAINLVPLSMGFRAREDDWCSHFCDQTVPLRDKGNLRNIVKFFKN